MRVSTYLVIIAGLMMLFNLAGFITVSGYVLGQLNIINNPGGFALSPMFLTITVVLTLVAPIGSIIIGTFTRTPPESYLLAGYASLLTLFVSDLISIVVTAQNSGSDYVWASWLVALICMPIVVGYIHSVASWWGGKTA
jgi:hypothetical protein